MILNKKAYNKEVRISKIDTIIDNKRSIISRKDFIWLDVEFYEGEFFISQKLSNYFAQLEERSYERIEKINNYVIDIYKNLDFDFFFFKENLDVKEDYEELYFFDDLLDYEIFSDIFTSFNSEFPEVDCEYLNLDETFEILTDKEEDFNSDEENSFDYNIIQFFVPLVLISYRNLCKKSDFYLSNQFNYHLFSKKNAILVRNKIIIKKFLNKKYLFKNFNKEFISKNFLKFKNLKSNFFKMLNNSNIFSLKKKYYTNKAHRLPKKYKKKKKKLSMFKKLTLKHKIEKSIILKSFKWYSNVYISMLLSIKSLHSYGKYSHTNFINNLYTLLSQIISTKLKFYKRYRRRKRLKKSFFRNFEGKLGVLNKEINDREQNKKDKRKNKRKF